MTNYELESTAIVTVAQLLQEQTSNDNDMEYVSLKKCLALTKQYQQKIEELSLELYDEVTQTIDYLSRLNEKEYQLFFSNVKKTVSLWNMSIQ